MSIIRFGRFIPTTLREWDRVMAPLNEVITRTENGTTVTADNLPSQDALYVTLSNNTSLRNDRVLAGATGEITVTDNGPNSTVDLGLETVATPGTYSSVTVDAKGRVTAGAALVLTGSGSPLGVVAAPPGTLYLNTLGGVSTTLYVKTSGTTSAGWTAK